MVEFVFLMDEGGLDLFDRLDAVEGVEEGGDGEISED